MTYRPYDDIIAAVPSSTGIEKNIVNNTSATINLLTPVRLNSSGELDLIDVSLPDLANSTIGVTKVNIPNASAGAVVLFGMILNVTVSFSFGDTIYVSKSGGLTNNVPAIGMHGFVAGDTVIKIGSIVKNATIPTQKDFIINIEIIGVL